MADDPSCDVAHGDAPAAVPARTLLAVYASPLASYLLHWGRELAFTTLLLEPDPTGATRAQRAGADGVLTDPARAFGVDGADPATTAVVVTDHHRDDLGAVLAPLVRARPGWVGIIGSPRHEGPHAAALRAAGVDDELVATVRRPIGVPIGSRTPAEIAISILAELVAVRRGVSDLRRGGP